MCDDLGFRFWAAMKCFFSFNSCSFFLQLLPENSHEIKLFFWRRLLSDESALSLFYDRNFMTWLFDFFLFFDGCWFFIRNESTAPILHRCMCSFFFRVPVWQSKIAFRIWNETSPRFSPFLMSISFITTATAAKFCNSHDQRVSDGTQKFTFMDFFSDCADWEISVILVGKHSDKPSDTSSSFNEQTALRIAPWERENI